MITLRYSLAKEYPVTTRFGEGGHWAVDIGCPEGTPVYADHAGILTGETTPGGGNVARITGDICVTRYCHLRRGVEVAIEGR